MPALLTCCPTDTIRAWSCICRCKCGIPWTDFFSTLRDFQEDLSSCRGLSTCLFSALTIAGLKSPPTLLLTGSVLDFSPSPGLCFCWSPHHLHHRHPYVRAWRAGQRKGAVFSRQIRPFVSVCAGGGGGGGTPLSDSGEAAAAGAEKEEGNEDRGRWGRQRGRKRSRIHRSVCVSGLSLIRFNRKYRILYQVLQQV